MGVAGESPAFSFYAKDFLMGTATMSLAARGAYITLLAYQWDRGSVPGTAVELARVWGCTTLLAKKLWVIVGARFVQGEDGQWRNARLELERQKQAARREALATNGRRGSDSRWQGHGPAIGKAIAPPLASTSQGDGLPSPSPSPSVVKERRLAASAPDFVSNHRAFKGQHLAVFDWMLMELRAMLGANADAFNLDEWFHELDGMAGKERAVVKNRWKWIQEKTLAEADRRGLPQSDSAAKSWYCDYCGGRHTGSAVCPKLSVS